MDQSTRLQLMNAHAAFPTNEKLTEMVVMGLDIKNDKAIKDQKLSGN